MKRKPVIGETLFDLNVGNDARRGTPQVLTPVIVARVGRKYFACARKDSAYGLETEYHIEDWRQRTDYCANHHLYESNQEWEDQKEEAELNDYIRNAFTHYNNRVIPLEGLRSIKAILDSTAQPRPNETKPD